LKRIIWCQCAWLNACDCKTCDFVADCFHFISFVC
jgi:hypothetical protein